MDTDAAPHRELHTFDLWVAGMHCRHTTRALGAAVRDLAGVRTVQRPTRGPVVRIAGHITPQQVVDHLHGLGFEVRAISSGG